MFVLAFALFGCSSESTAAKLDATYENIADGISVRYPKAWQRASPKHDLSLMAGDGRFEMIGLTTDSPFPGSGACAPAPWDSGNALSKGGLVFTLQLADSTPGPFIGGGGDRPKDLLAMREPSALVSGGCHVDGLRFLSEWFREKGQTYVATLALRGSLNSRRQAELRAMWSSLTLDPVVEEPGGARTGVPYMHWLYFHCGLVATNFNGTEWRVHELQLGRSARNSEPGHMTLVSPGLARFESRDGTLVVEFRPPVDSDPPLETGCA